MRDLAQSRSVNRASAVGEVGPDAVGRVVAVAPIPVPGALASESHVGRCLERTLTPWRRLATSRRTEAASDQRSFGTP